MIIRKATFSILERIDVGETLLRPDFRAALQGPFSILERIDVGETFAAGVVGEAHLVLSVSSNGSTWVKPTAACRRQARSAALSVSSNGSTWVKRMRPFHQHTPNGSFSILERIDVGETRVFYQSHARSIEIFQYPRTDRRG